MSFRGLSEESISSSPLSSTDCCKIIAKSSDEPKFEEQEQDEEDDESEGVMSCSRCFSRSWTVYFGQIREEIIDSTSNSSRGTFASWLRLEDAGVEKVRDKEDMTPRYKPT